MKGKLFLLFTCSFLSLLITTNAIAQQPVTTKSIEMVDRLPSIPFLPDPLLIDEGTRNIPIVNKEQWQNKSNWIKDQYQYAI